MYIDLINASKELLDQGHTFTTPEIGLCAGALCSPNLFKQIKTTFNLKRIAVIYFIMQNKLSAELVFVYTILMRLVRYIFCNAFVTNI